jgi:hypothetical protein
MSGTVITFMSQRIAVASALYEGQCGGSIEDAILILSGAASAIASEIWPGEGIDRKRIVKMLITYASSSPHRATISIPLLHQALNSDPAARLALESTFLDYDDAPDLARC